VHPTYQMLTWAHPSPQPKRHLDQFSYFCTAHGRMSPSMPEHVLSPKNCPFVWGDLDPHLIYGSYRPTRVKIPNDISIGSAVFAEFTAECPYTLQWAAAPHKNCPFSWGDLMVPWAHPSLNPNGISISSAVLQGSLL